METETTLPADKLEDKESEEFDCFSTQMHQAMAPTIKKFLVDYFGARMYNLEAETYREIDEIIKDAFIFGCDIVNHLHIYRTIKDEHLWEEAFNNFKRKDAKFNWQKMPQWCDREYANDDDDKFQEGIFESELTEEQKIAKELVEGVDKMISFQNGFSDFMKQGCELIISGMQKFIEENASFDLTFLSPDGYEQVQEDLEEIAASLFDRLDFLFPEEA
jgi:hypothetical protein